jgi:hypothetical protein
MVLRPESCIAVVVVPISDIVEASYPTLLVVAALLRSSSSRLGKLTFNISQTQDCGYHSARCLLPCEQSSILFLNVCKISASSLQMHCFGLIPKEL